MDLEDYDVLNTVLDDDTSQFVRSMNSTTDPVLNDIEKSQVNDDFPIVGPEVGKTLQFIAQLTGVKRAFEFGSGRGYSAYWIASILPSDGEIILTDFKESNLRTAQKFFERGEFVDRSRFEVGNALEIYREYDGLFDFILIDNLEEEYLETFKLVRDDIQQGGVICADNVMTGPAVQDKLALEALQGNPNWEAMDKTTTGVVEYLLAVRSDDAFETVLIPVGEGLAVSFKV